MSSGSFFSFSLLLTVKELALVIVREGQLQNLAGKPPKLEKKEKALKADDLMAAGVTKSEHCMQKGLSCCLEEISL